MIQTGFEKRVSVQQIIENQIPEFILSESPKTIDFLKQYYISQEHQGGPADIAVNLDQYLKVDNLTPEVISGETTLYSDVTSSSDTVQVYSTKGYPSEYGLFQIGNEVFTYTGITTNTFTGCERGFSGITSYRSDLNAEELVFSDTSATSHNAGATVKNLSALFLKDFYKKLKHTFTPGLEDVDFQSELDVNNFIKESRSLYESKGTEESFKILFKVLYGVEPQVVDLEQYLPKPSSAEFLRREIVVAERISGDPAKLVGQTIRKSTDSATQGAVSEVEVFTRSGISTYYKMGLFVGYDDNALIEGTFTIQPKTKVINPVSPSESTITVDSTIGFGATGTLISGTNVITYLDKSINQFYNCQGVTNSIDTSDEIRTSEVFVGYEDGDPTKKVEIRLTGVLSEFETVGDILDATEDQILYVKNIGEKIKNPANNKTNKETFANSWIYNTSCRFDITNINSGSSTISLETEIDESSLDIGDKVDILLGNSENIALSNAIVRTIDKSLKQITLDNMTGFSYSPTQDYTLRRNLNTSTSSGTPLVYGQNKITSDVQNVYNENDEFFYVASNSLPSYDITTSTIKYTISTSTSGVLDGYDDATQKYTIISFSASSLDFITGDEIYYKPDGDPLTGLKEGYYYIKVLDAPNNNKIKLYLSRSLIVSDTSIGFTAAGTTHNFVLASQRDDAIHPQKLLKKFPHSQDIKTGTDIETIPGSTGMLINGVEIINYKSLDKVYYGPLDMVQVYNGGKNYDVINPPTVTVAAGAGTTALVQTVLSGSVVDIEVDPQAFDIESVQSAVITGGNGSGAVLEPMVGFRQRESQFDCRADLNGGGISIARKEITFVAEHNFVGGEQLLYDSNGNSVLGVLRNNTVYYPDVIDEKTIKLYANLTDYNARTNPVGLTTNSQGFHKFKKLAQTKTLREVKIISGGSGYTNRKLIVKPVGINTVHNTINFKNHGFSDGEKVVYSTDGTTIGGLLTTNQYQIIKINDDSFKVANAGVGGTITSNYTRKEFVGLTSTGSGYQNFAYPDITLTINATLSGVGTATQSVGVITATPIVRGSIVDAYLYEKGTGYGSTILNYNKEPIITIKSGKNAEFKPIIVNGGIDRIDVTYGGSEYTSPPDLTFVGVGSGIGAKARAIVSGGKVTNAVVLNKGIGYDANTGIAATSIGLNGYLESSVRALTLNNFDRFEDEILLQNAGGLQYGIVGHSTAIAQVAFGDNLNRHSPIIGWAYDGNPIYGPFAYSDPENINSSLEYLRSGYTASTSNIVDRPSGYSSGFFVEDYKFTNAGDLDEHNGRYTKTPDFPNGVYAYYATVEGTGKDPAFPFFIGNTYRSDLISQTVNQSFDFNTSDLVRNTFPYKVTDLYANNDFLSEPYEIVQQRTVIDGVSKGSIEDFIINESGEGYAVDDVAVFDNTGTNGGGLSAYVSQVSGQKITSIDTSIETYQDTSVVWDNSKQVSIHTTLPHALLDQDSVVISGVSTFIAGLTNSHIIGVSSEKTYLLQDIKPNTVAGFVTDIYVSAISESVSVGSTIAIGVTDREDVSILNIFKEQKVIRVIRGTNTGTGHTASSEISTVPTSFTIPLKTSYFESRLNDKVWFNPIESVGLGTVTGGAGISTYRIGDISEQISIPYQSIYIPNHPFKNNQEVIFRKRSGSNQIKISRTPDSALLNMPSSGDSETYFVINKGVDHIGLTTAVGFNTTGFYFRSFANNNDSRDWRYSLESNFTKETARVEKIKAIVAVSTSHELANNDIINLSVKSNQSVGIGTSVAVRVKYNSKNDKLIVNPSIFANTALNVSSNEFTITKHGLKTGDKIFYDSTTSQPFVGLATGSYYVYRVDDDKFNLAITRVDSTSEPPILLDLAAPASAGTTHEISKINPQIEVIENNNLVFDVRDSSLSGYNLKIYYDDAFNNELVGVAGTVTDFNIVNSGTVGTGTATVTLNYSSTLPSKLYYTLEKGGYISTSDTDVADNSEIIFNPSKYNGSYSIAGVGTTSFNLSLRSVPEALSYVESTSSTLKYSTSSKTARGGVERMMITSGGLNYKKTPQFKNITSSKGVNADIIPQSSAIGRIKQVTIQDPGFDFSADKTLNPEVFISPTVTVVDRNTISGVSVISGGSGYVSAPDLVVVDPSTGLPYTTGVLSAKLQGSSISEVTIQQAPRGLSESKNTVYTTNNTNGIGIEKVESSLSGIVTCTITTPINQFSSQPFAVGDKVFVEGIQKLTGIYSTVGLGSISNGQGFNSEDNGYVFFPITKVTTSNPVVVEFDLSSTGTYPGIAQTNQNGFAVLVNKNVYPTFKVDQVPLDFIVDEPILVRGATNTFVWQDLVVTNNLNDQIKVYGTYELKVGDVILGRDSGTTATVKGLTSNKAIFKIDYSLRKDLGWSNDTGKLNEDFQVLPDNDYYQNLSYTVKSPIEYDDLVNPVNRLLHTTGLKNFSDTGITTTTNVSIATSELSSSLAIIDVINEKRVDTIADFDFGIDIDAVGNKSRYVQFKNKRLSDYINCDTNRVLKIDDISSGFSKADPAPNLYTNIDSITAGVGFNRYLVQVINPDNRQRQVTDIITLTDNSGDIFTLEKGSIGIALTGSNNSYKVDRIAEIGGNVDEGGNITLRFEPQDVYNQNYDVKTIKHSFASSSAGIGTNSIGFIDLVGSSNVVGVGTTVTIVGIKTDKNEGFFVQSEIINSSTDEMSYVELYVDQDGDDTYIADFHFDNQVGSTSNFIGTFGASVSSGVISLKFTNSTETSPVLFRSRVVGFGTTAVGEGTYRFLSSGQQAGTEKTAKYQSNYIRTQSISNLLSVPKADITSIKSIVKVGYGETSALHQLLSIHDGTDVYTTQYPYLSIGSNAGIGTFGSEFSGANILLRFYPDSGIQQDIVVQSYSEILYTDQDLLNIPNDNIFGSVREKFINSTYSGSNTGRQNLTKFALNYNGIPIFRKTFNPATKVTLASGLFTIQDHFFETGEKLSYKAVSTFSNITASAMVMTGGAVLPATVYAIKVTSDTFKLATSKSNATGGTAITFQGAGAGNAHTLDMSEKESKTVLSLDGIVQHPLAYTPVNYTLTDNFGSITASDTFISLSGISSILPEDILKIDDEFVKVNTVGLGTTAVGPITETGTFNLVNVERGFVGTTAASHNDAAVARVYLGAFNIVANNIHFAEPPIGNNIVIVDPLTNLPTPRSTFGGRVYLRQDYTSNRVYDSISKSFTGIGATYGLSVEGTKTGLGATTDGSGLLFINNVFQTPTTDNNMGNTYDLTQNNTGITTIKFTGITDSNGDLVISDYDVNKNQLPRGGMIVSLGSSLGIGYAQPVGASVTAVLNSSGAITKIGIGSDDNNGSGYRGVVGVGITDEAYVHRFVQNDQVGVIKQTAGPQPANNIPTGATYVSHTGMLTLTLGSPINIVAGNIIRIPQNSLKFTCSRDNHATVHTYPRATDPAGNNANLTVISATSTTITVDVGDGGGRGSGATATTVVGAGGTIVFNVTAGGSNYVNPRISLPTPSYHSLGVVGVSRRGVGMTTKTGTGLLLDLDVSSASPTPQDNKFGDASLMIDKNSLFIADVAAYRMLERFPSFNVPTGTQNCIDDIVDVLGAVAYNTKYGGNDRTVDAGNLYIQGNHVNGEEEESIYAFHQARDMAVRAMRNETVYTHLGAQYAHTYTSGTVANAVVAGGDYTHTWDSADANAVTVVSGGSGNLTPSSGGYNAATGILTLEFASNHNLNGNGAAGSATIKLADGSLKFKCARDGNKSVHAYPRTPFAHKFVSSANNAINGSLKPSDADYDPVTGILTLTFTNNHNVANNGNVTIANNSLTFTCSKDAHATEHTYPRPTDPASGTTLTATLINTKKFSVDVGESKTGDPISGITSAITKTSNTAFTIFIGKSPLTFKSVVAGAGAEATKYDAKTGDLVLNVGSNHGFNGPITLAAPTAVTYAPTSGVLRLTIPDHGCSLGDYIRIADKSITFTCARDNHSTKHEYPRSTDHVSGKWLPIHQVSSNRIWVNVGQSQDTSAHTFVSATAGIEMAGDNIGIGTNKLGFKCTRDATDANPGGVAQQTYPRPGDPFCWNKAQISIASTTTSTVTVNVGVSSTSHTPKQQTFDHSIPVDSGSPACANVASAIHTLVGIVTDAIKKGTVPTRTLSSFETYEVTDFKIARSGYGFKVGDVFKPVGLVTDRALSAPKSEFSLTVLDTFTDGFASWQFGELDYIDSIKDLQNGLRTRFPLYYKGDLLSFETTNGDVDLNAVLLIFVNGVIQEPGEHYTFEGGTSFNFSTAPKEGESISIFFYRGTRGLDSSYVNVNESLKQGDMIQLKRTGDIGGQDSRTVSGISSSDKIQTNVYNGININEVDYRLVDWSKQKVDKNIGGEYVYKSRDSIEGQVYPTARIIGDVPSSGISTIYVDNAQFFNYEENESSIVINECSGLIVQNTAPVAAAITAVVSGMGTVSALTVTSGGSGYVGTAVTVFIARPTGIAVTFSGGKEVYTGLATAKIPVVNGALSGTANITSPGAGYTYTRPPQVIAPLGETVQDELIVGIVTVKGFSGIITGISQVTGIGAPKALRFDINARGAGNFTNDLKVGYPICVSDTTFVGSQIGYGLTSIDTHEKSTVGIGTTFADNIYIVSGYHRFDANSGIITCNISNSTPNAGLTTTAGINTSTIGTFSWGILGATGARNLPLGIGVTGLTYNPGLTTFPTIQRRGFGIRSNGALRKDLG